MPKFEALTFTSIMYITNIWNLSTEFYDAIIEKYCIHCKVCLELKPSEIFPLTDGSFPWSFGSDILDVQVLEEKPILCAVLSSGTYGLGKNCKNFWIFFFFFW